jgi:ribosome-binding ATPase YchF (GTP1/OBG family)
VAAEAEALDLDLVISDLSKIENRLPRLEASLKKTSGKERERLQIEQAALDRVRGPLEAGTPIREISLTPEEQAALRGFAFLTQKPILYLVNCESPQEAGAPETLAPLGGRASRPRAAAVALAGQIEEEIAQLAPGTRRRFWRTTASASRGAAGHPHVL